MQALSQLLSNNMDIYREKANEALQRDRDSYRESMYRKSLSCYFSYLQLLFIIIAAGRVR